MNSQREVIAYKNKKFRNVFLPRGWSLSRCLSRPRSDPPSPTPSCPGSCESRLFWRPSLNPLSDSRRNKQFRSGLCQFEARSASWSLLRTWEFCSQLASRPALGLCTFDDRVLHIFSHQPACIVVGIAREAL